MSIYRGRDRCIQRIGRGELNAAIISQRCIDRQRARGDMRAKRSSQFSETRSSRAEIVIRSFVPSSTAAKLLLRSSGTAFSLTSPLDCPLHASVSKRGSLSTRSQRCRAGRCELSARTVEPGAAGEIDDACGVEAI